VRERETEEDKGSESVRKRERGGHGGGSKGVSERARERNNLD